MIIVMKEVSLFDGSGIKESVRTALGMTNTLSGSIAALSTVFSLLQKQKYHHIIIHIHSYLQCDTQMTLPTSPMVNFNHLFVMIELPSANPNKE